MCDDELTALDKLYKLYERYQALYHYRHSGQLEPPLCYIHLVVNDLRDAIANFEDEAGSQIDPDDEVDISLLSMCESFNKALDNVLDYVETHERDYDKAPMTIEESEVAWNTITGLDDMSARSKQIANRISQGLHNDRLGRAVLKGRKGEGNQ